MLLRARTRQPMTNRLALLTHWLVCQKLNHASSVQLHRSLRALCYSAERIAYRYYKRQEK